MTVETYLEGQNLVADFKGKILDQICGFMENKTGKKSIAYSKLAVLIFKPGFDKQEIIVETSDRVEKAGLEVVFSSPMKYDKETARQHYIDLAGKPFVGELTDYLSSGDCFGMLVYGDNAIQKVRDIACGIGGSTYDLKPDGIRWKYAVWIDNKPDLTRNVLHATGDVTDVKGELNCFINGAAQKLALQKVQKRENIKADKTVNK